MLTASMTTGMAIAFHNSVAIFKGTFGIKTPFNRTPKYDASDKKNIKAATDKTYRVKASWIAYAELALVFYFIVALFLDILLKNYLFVSYHFALILVFAVISFLSLGLGYRFAKNNNQ